MKKSSKKTMRMNTERVKMEAASKPRDGVKGLRSMPFAKVRLNK